MHCVCGHCFACREDERFERIYGQLHGREERLYYAERSAVRTANSNSALADARRFKFGLPQIRRARPKRAEAA